MLLAAADGVVKPRITFFAQSTYDFKGKRLRKQYWGIIPRRVRNGWTIEGF